MIPQKPSFLLGYYRPWNENKSVFDSYLDYVRDTSLIKFGADTIGNYIKIASEDQISAINKLSNEVGVGFNLISQQMNQINENLIFIHKKLDLQIEQQKLSNLLLNDISELLKIPDKEKERQHAINLGLKFFINAQNYPELFIDALNEFLKAESLMSQDYFVLHRIGCIYLYAPNLINPEKALDYFQRAAKYAIVESKPTSARFINVLMSNRLHEDLDLKPIQKVKISFNNSKLTKIYTIKIISEKFGNGLSEVQSIVENKNNSLYISQNIQDAEKIKIELEEIGISIEIIQLENKNSDEILSNDPTYINYIKTIASESLEKAAFSAYIIGDFDKAVSLQSSSINYNKNPDKLFILSKYLIRNGQKNEALKNINEAIEIKPILAIGIFSDLDLISENSILDLVASKSKEINDKIENLILLVNSINQQSTEKIEFLKALEDLKLMPYDKKIKEVQESEIRFFNIQNKIESRKNQISIIHNSIDEFTNTINDYAYQTFSEDKINSLVNDLIFAKENGSDEIVNIFEKVKLEVEKDKVKVGTLFNGGIVFHMDDGKHGLICSENDLGKYIWGASELFIGATNREIGKGASNTLLICDKASTINEKGLFRSTVVKITTSGNVCKSYNYEGLSDWHLPSLDELKKIYFLFQNKGLGNFSKSNYWSSTEYDANEAYRVNFGSGDVFGIKKNKECHVIAVRSF
jgi:ribosomal protein L7/L12